MMAAQAITFLASIRLNAIIGQAQKTTPERLWLYHIGCIGVQGCARGEESQVLGRPLQCGGGKGVGGSSKEDPQERPLRSLV